MCQTPRDNIGSNSRERFYFFDQLADWTTYCPWRDLCRDFIRPCSIKSALWLSSYVPSQCLEWLALIDITAKCQVIMAVIICLDAAVSLWIALWPCWCTFMYRHNRCFFLCLCVCVSFFSNIAGWEDYHNAQGCELFWIWNTVLRVFRQVKGLAIGDV